MTQSNVSRSPAKAGLTAREKRFLGLCKEVLLDVNTPLCQKVVSQIDSSDWDGVCSNAMPNPRHYSSASIYAGDYLAYGMLRKWDRLPLLVDRKAACIQKWLQAEAACKVVNENHGRLPMADHGPLEGRLEALLWSARRKIRDCLGSFSWDEAYGQFSFSGGASTRLTRRSGHPFYKFSGKPEVTRNCALLAICTIWHSEPWRLAMQDAYGHDPVNWVTVVEGSRFATVGKTALIDRPICIEPCMNMFIQKGIGAVIRSRLKRVRIDLNDQSRNQRLAAIGSRTGSLVTIDLSSASDSVSLELVKWLIPHDWYEALCFCRSESVIFEDGTKHRLEKISSMGNGYTFELESLIFWALTAACVETYDVPDKRIGVYGDDIIVHNSVAERLIELLQYAGFTTNVDKTFIDGPFRESCGKHYFHGADVTPYYVKQQVGDLQDLYWLANSVRTWSGCITRAYKKIIKEIGKHGTICRVPESFGSRAGLMLPLDESRPSWDVKSQQWRFYAWMPVRRKFRPNGTPALLAWLIGLRDEERVMVIDKGDVIWRKRACVTSRWQ